MHIRTLIAACILATLGTPAPGMAAEWFAEPAISLRTGYDDNPRLTSSPHDSVWETALSPAMRFGLATETQGITGDARMSVRRYFGGTGPESSSALDREDYYLKSSAFHKSLRDTYRFAANYTRDSTLESQLDQGVITTARATRAFLDTGPTWTHMLDNLSSLELGYRLNLVRYSDKPTGSALIDYNYHTFSGTWSRVLSERITGQLAAGYSSYQPDTGFDSDTLTLQAGISANIREDITATLLLGQRATTYDKLVTSGFCIGGTPGSSFDNCAANGGIPVISGTRKGSFDSSSLVFSSSILRKLETGSLSAGLTRSSSPGGNGELLDTTRLLFNGDYKLTETLKPSLKIEYTENETIVNATGSTSQDKNTFFRVVPKLTWQWQREWTMAAEYSFSSRDQASTGTADRNQLYFTLSYLPTKLSVSR